MKRWGRKGSHVGMMIAFSLFILLLVSIIIIIQPVLDEKGGKKPILELINQRVIENVSSNLTLTLIKISSSSHPVATCIQFDNSFSGGENSLVKNISNQRINSNDTDSAIQIAWGTEPLFLKIYSSPENFEESPIYASSCASLTKDSNYSIESIQTQEYIFESSVEKLKAVYNTSYESLKNNLSISTEDEFGFLFMNNTGGVISAGRKPSSESIYSKENKILYVDNKSQILPGVLVVEVW